MEHRLRLGLALLCWACCGTGAAQQAAAPVIAAGTVADEATKSAILARLRELYGASRVVDQIGVGNVVTPPNWSGYVQKLITPSLKSISRGQLAVDGTSIAVKGEVQSEALRQQIVSEMATNLNPTYVVKNGLRVAAADQSLLDQTLANRIVEFDSGRTTLTAQGQAILDEMAAALQKLGGRKVEIVGHTDNHGSANANLTLSRARAEAVKTYLVGKGIDGAALSTAGMGPDRPVAPNDTPEGRARNRRIEFRVGK